MIFPGMDPYLEDPRLWPGVHSRLIVYLCDFLQPQLQPRYVAAIEERVYLQGTATDRIPDVSLRRGKNKRSGAVAMIEMDEPLVVTVPEEETHETYVTILDTQANQQLVTVIEVISPTNKYAGPGRESYRNKQQDVLHSKVHLVEIDLLRTGPHVLAVPERVAQNHGAYDYLACVNRAAGTRMKFDLYPRRLVQRLPRIRIPLAGRDADVCLDVQAILEQTHDHGCYGTRLAYDKPCEPPLSPADQAWAKRILKEAKAQSTRGNGTKRRRKDGGNGGRKS